MKAYAIASPDYDHTSGGIKVMWGLFGHLLARGYEVYMNRYPNAKEFIAIYPETLHGNMMNAPVVARYMLNKAGIMGVGAVGEPLKAGPKEFDKSEKTYYFSRLFGDTDDDHYMFLPVINMDIFKDQKKNRDKSAVFIGKGEDLGLHRPSTIITREDAKDQQDLADFLNECHTLYSYDPVSAMSEVARLCGTRVVLLNNEYSKEDYTNKYEAGANGISFGEDTGEGLDVEAFRSHYKGLKDRFEVSLDKFIEDTQS